MTDNTPQRVVRAALLACASCTMLTALPVQAELTEDKIRDAIGGIDTAAIIANDKADRNWPSYGLNYGETRFSQLNQINEKNVGELGLAWSYDLKSKRGVETTPIVVDGVMYATGSWSIVHALDAVTGKLLWVYDPDVPRDIGYKGCCDVVNRGVAVYGGNVYVGSYDGYLHAIDSATGKQVWKVDTIIDRTRSYTITGAPRVINGRVLIGNGGAEMGVRGYVTAYDAKSGKQDWRFYTVPSPDLKPENKTMEMALKTWDPDGAWRDVGGGGTVWDAMAYDPELNLLYIGVGNPTPWNQAIRSPKGGDNLFVAAIVALNADTGEYVWHYQGTPGDSWDYTHTQHIIVTDLELDGKKRRVVMQAPKNGFFYVLDAATGKFISANNFVTVNWASGYDKDGRPIENPAARATKDGKVFETIPSAYGAHNWHPMSFNPQTGLAYIPAQHVPLTITDDKGWKPDTHVPGSAMSGVGWNLGSDFNVEPPAAAAFGSLIAWDPVAQKEAWTVKHLAPWNGGTLTTAGNLVFQGTAHGTFAAYNATDGKKLWETPVTNGVVAPPVTWEKDGTQYVTLAVGWGGVFGQLVQVAPGKTPGKLVTFKLGGTARMPDIVANTRTELVHGVPYKPEDIAEGADLYVANCVFCHGVPAINNGGNIPNLGYSTAETIANLKSWVTDGAGLQNGMPVLKHLTPADIGKITAFIQGVTDGERERREKAKAN